MRGRELGAGSLGAVALVVSSLALAGPVAAQAGRPPAATGARPANDDSVGGTAPDSDDDSTLPSGHPPVDTSNPHAHASASGAMPGVFRPPDDVEQEDPALTAGSISIDLRDPDDRPVSHETVNLGILINSIAKGDTRKHMQASTDDRGHAEFVHLETQSNIAYRVSVGYQGGMFAATPFQLPQGKAMHVVLHVYPVTRDIPSALIVCEAVIAAELRDDRIQIEEALTVYNLGRTAWQPEGVSLSLPLGYTAFTAQPSMSDQGVDAIDGAAKLHGTFSPGQHQILFRWQLPWSGDRDVDFDVGLPPHVAIARILMPASGTIKLSAAGFPPTEVLKDSHGQSFLVSERRLRPDDARLTSLTIGIHDLPTEGPGRLVATVLAALGVGTGLLLIVRRGRRPLPVRDPVEARDALLEELAELEDARAADQVGPLTYGTARRELIDRLALTLVHL